MRQAAATRTLLLPAFVLRRPCLVAWLAVAGAAGCAAADDAFYAEFARDVERTGDSALAVVRARRLTERIPPPAQLDTTLAALERHTAAFAALSPPDSAVGVEYERMRASADSLVVAVRTLLAYAATCSRPDTATTTWLSCGESGGPTRLALQVRGAIRTYLVGREAARKLLDRHGVSLGDPPSE